MIMNLNSIKLFFVFVLLIFSSCNYGQTNENRQIEFFQEGKKIVVSKFVDSIILERKPFSIKFYGKKYDGENDRLYSTQIAVIDNIEETYNIKEGQNISDVKCFEPGTGLAAGDHNKYDEMFITNNAHHYLTYEEAEKEKRVELISMDNDFCLFEWKISAAYYKKETVSFSNLELNTLYIVVLNNINLNEKIDSTELKIIHLKFK